MSLPPPQAMAMPSVQLADDDDILMDYDDDPLVQAAPPTAVAADTAMDIEPSRLVPAVASEDDLMSPEKVYIHGVDNMNSSALKDYSAECFPDGKVLRLEWIDDSSCNLVYSTPAIASRALEAFTSTAEATILPPLTLRAAKPSSSSPDSRLHVRISCPSDRKERGARERSRYYLFHPEEDRAEKLRNERHERRPRSTDYNRRPYDAREHSRRRENDYSEDFYDERPQRRRSRSRSRSPPRRRRRTRSRSPLRNRGRELFPEKRARSDEPLELFPERAKGVAAMDSYVAPQQARSDSGERWQRTPQSVELFPEKVGTRELFPDKAGGQKAIELFPKTLFGRKETKAMELFPENAPTKQSKSLADRITMPPKSLAERISFSDGDGVGGFQIKGASKGDGIGDIGDDLFAQKMMSAKGEGLLAADGWGGGGGGRRRKGGRRSRAEDFLG